MAINDFPPVQPLEDTQPLSVDDSGTLEIGEEARALSVDNFEGMAPVVPLYLAEQRAAKAFVGLPDLGKSYEDFLSSMTGGYEFNFREEAAYKVNNKRHEQAKKFVEEAVRMAGGPLTSETAKFISDKYNELSKTTPASTVFEEAFSEQYFNTLYRSVINDPDSFFAQAVQEAPAETDKAVRVGSEILTKNQIALRVLQDTVEDVKNQGWGDWLIDFAKTIVPTYTSIKLRGNVKDSGFFEGGTLGENLNQQMQRLWLLPPDQFERELVETVNRLKADNPQVAVQFAAAMRGLTTSEQALISAIEAVDLASIPGVGALAKVTGRAAKAKAVAKIDEVKGAVKDMVKSADRIETGEPVKVAAAEGAGDVAEAVVQRVTNDVVNNAGEATSKTFRQHMDRLFDVFNFQMENIAKAPGSLSTDATNRLLQAYERTKRGFGDLITSGFKVDRTPGVMQTEDAIRAIWQSERDAWPGLKNGILNISRPEYIPSTNTWGITMEIGYKDGTLFSSFNQAKQFARVNNIPTAEVARKGNGFVLKYSKSIDETSDVVRDFLIAGEKDLEEIGILRSLIGGVVGAAVEAPGRLKTADNVLNAIENMNRKIATYGPSNHMKFLLTELKHIENLAQGFRKGFARIDPETGLPQTGHLKYQGLGYRVLGRKEKQKWEQFRQILLLGRELDDYVPGPDGLTQKGRFIRDPAELIGYYQQFFRRTPDEAEIAAYYSFVRLHEIDASLRNLHILRNLQRWSGEKLTIRFTNPDGSLVSSEAFNGKILKKIPGGDDQVMIIRKDGHVEIKQANELSVKELEGYSLKPGKNPPKGSIVEDIWGRGETSHRREITEARVLGWRQLVERGQYQVAEVWDVDRRQLNNFSDKIKSTDRIRYVISPAIERAPLDFHQLPRRGGGHVELDYDWYIKQGNVVPVRAGKNTKWVYEGDSTIMPILTRAMGKDVAQKLDRVRVLLKEGDTLGAKTYAQANLPIKWAELQSWFNPQKNPVTGKINPPRLNLEEPIQVVQNGRSIIDVDNNLANRYVPRGTFQDGTSSGSAARQYQVEFTGQRDSYDLFTFRDVGTRGNPIYNIEPARLVDPIPSINRALSRISRSSFMDDYKIGAVESWLKRAANVLDVDNPTQLRYRPFYHFNKAGTDKNAYKAGADPKVVNQLKAEHWAIDQFLGKRNKLEENLDYVAQLLHDRVYTGLGPRVAGVSTQSIDPGYMLAKLSDPTRFFRSIAFHAKLGLYNIPQIFVQMQTYATMAGLAGWGPTANALAAATMSQWARINLHPNILKAMDKNMRVFGWKPGEFMESQRLMDNSGFGNVAGEQVILDNPFKTPTFKSAGREFLDTGTVFFTEGERMVRYGAWHLAYREWRKANPNKAITKEAEREILNRADMLSGNMSRASASMMNHGALSVPTQFYTYMLRLAELFWSKRIGETPLERNYIRARMAFTYGLMYGAPTVTGAAGLPIADSIRKYAMSNANPITGESYVVGNDWLETMLFEGVPAMLIAWATGGGNWRKGEMVNFGDRYGIQGPEFARELLKDEGWWKVILGASGSTIYGAFERSGGLTQAIMSQFRQDSDRPFKPVIEDLIDPLKEISSINAGYRLWVALRTNQWLSKNENYLADTSPSRAMLHTLLGTQPTSVADLHLYAEIMKKQGDGDKQTEKFFIKEYNRGRMIEADNPEQAVVHYRRAYGMLELMGYPQDRWAALHAKTHRSTSPLEERMDIQYYIKRAPAEKRQMLEDAFRRREEIREERGTQ